MAASIVPSRESAGEHVLQATVRIGFPDFVSRTVMASHAVGTIAARAASPESQKNPVESTSARKDETLPAPFPSDSVNEPAVTPDDATKERPSCDHQTADGR